MSSVGDPRVEAVADALGGPMGWTTWRADALRIAAVAVAALDAYDLDRETPEGGRKAAAVARAVLAERDRIARTIGQEWQRRSDEWGYRVDSHQEGVLDGLAEAEEIARGQS